MQIRMGSDAGLDRRYEGDSRAAIARLEFVPSIESQSSLRALYEYVEACRTALNEIKTNLSLLESDPECFVYIKSACEQLANFCIEADSWGFDSLYEISSGLQMLLLDSGDRVKRDDFWKALYRGLAMLSALLELCESDYLRRLAIADTFESIR